jgi:hypothetical protein
MNEVLILGGILAALWLGLLYLRVPTSIAFLSLLIGQLLASEASANVYEFLGSILRGVDANYIQMTLLLLPLLLTVLFLKGRVAKSKLPVEAVPALLLAALTIMVLAPFLTQLNGLLEGATNGQASAYKSIVVVAASVSGLLSAWLSYPRASHKASGKHSRHL